MFTYIDAADIATRVGQDIEGWDSPSVNRAQAIADETCVYVLAITSLDLDENSVVPDRVRTATVSIASRHWLERSSDVSKERLGDWSTDYVDFGTFTEVELTTTERALLSPWLTKNPGFGQISVVPAFARDNTVYVPVADTAENFPLYED